MGLVRLLIDEVSFNKGLANFYSFKNTSENTRPAADLFSGGLGRNRGNIAGFPAFGGRCRSD